MMDDRDHHHHPEHRISVLVPFRADHAAREELWEWLDEYWEHELPDAEIIVGHDWASEDIPFSKTAAVNDAFERSSGDIIVILDADAYLSGEVIEHCARRLRHARRHGARTWFVPYQHMYRLNQALTAEVLESDPEDPLRFCEPPDDRDNDGDNGSGPGRAHHYGALIQIMPREAFELVGGMDCRFRGWGGEDVSFLRALDTLWGRHKKTNNNVFHLWHPRLRLDDDDRPSSQYLTRIWGRQIVAGANNWLAARYNRASFRPETMRKLVEGGRVPHGQ